MNYSPEVRKQAVAPVFRHQSEQGSQWAAVESIAAKIGRYRYQVLQNDIAAD